MGIRKFVKRLAKKITPKPLRRLVDKSLMSFLDPKAFFREHKRVAKSIIRKPGKWLKPKMPEQQAPQIIEQPDEELLARSNKNRRGRRTGSRANSMLSDTLG